MDADHFNVTIAAQLDRSSRVLIEKNAEYNPAADKLKSFKTASDLQGISIKDALVGMMAKDTVSVYDMCRSGMHYDVDVWNEKITSHINYLLLLRAIVEEEQPFTPEFENNIEEH